MTQPATDRPATEADTRPGHPWRSPTVIALGVVAAAGWVVLVLAETTGLEGLVDHDVAVEAGLPGAPLFVTGWVIMIAAMMLPSIHPLVARFEQAVAGRPDRVGLLVRLVAGYLTVWTAAGVAAYLGDLVVHALEDNTAVLAGREWVLTAGVFALAGGFQLTSLKDRCLTACRSPAGFVKDHWRGLQPRREALRLGVAHGRCCLGCCWGLMLVMFAVSTADLLWMLLLGAVMLIEKTAGWGRRLVPAAGAAALLAAAAVTWANLA